MFLYLFSSCFYKVYFCNCVTNRSNEVRLALIIPTGTSITVANEATETPPLFADKTCKVWQNNQMWQCVLLSVILIVSFLRMLAIN